MRDVKIKRWIAKCNMVLLLLTSTNAFLTAQTERPNILLIIADDMGVDITNGYQDAEFKPTTPHLDSLQQSGVTFTNAWSSPQCTPTRAAIMSGKYGIKTGVMRPPGNLDLIHESVITQINDRTNDAYQSAVIGKWHISNPVEYTHPQMHGIDHYEGLFTSSVPDYYVWEKVKNGELETVNEYVTTHITDAAIDWVTTQDDPWFLWLAHVAPHSPFHTPPDSLFSVENTDNNLNKYIAAIEAMDHEVGRLLDHIPKDELKNTIVFFIGDNGTPGGVNQNFPAGHNKGSLYEGGIRVPMIVSGFGVNRANEMEPALTQVLDIHATILEYAGIPLPGGIHNSLSLKPLLSCTGELERSMIYTDYSNDGQLQWAIRNDQYKLIVFEDGTEEFYDLSENALEEENLIDNLNVLLQKVKEGLSAEAEVIRSGWSCQDGIQNGEESAIDACEDSCSDDQTLSTENIGCCEDPDEPSVFYSFLEADKRNIYTNNFPSHSYCYNPNQIPAQKYYLFRIDLNPQVTAEITSVVRPNGRPAGYFGVAKNGVIMAPAPAQPFIFENPNTGEFNWDWVFEPTNNQGDGMDLVALDCASAHTGPQGYHYHGEMFEYLETISPGITTTQIVPEAPLHIGWAADGFPILYRYGPNAIGNMTELQSSYQLKSGLRPGNGIEDPCGAYNGKYTNDYEYICGKGDLDECNGIQQSIVIETAQGSEEFEYFYVITSRFPQVPRCLVGNYSTDFENGNPSLTGMDLDEDGFIDAYDCDDQNADINPLATEIEGNDIDENCDGLITSISDALKEDLVIITPNPSSGQTVIQNRDHRVMSVDVYDQNGRKIKSVMSQTIVHLRSLPPGLYYVKVGFEASSRYSVKKLIVQ